MYQYDNYKTKQKTYYLKTKTKYKTKTVSWNFNGINNFEDNSKDYSKIYSKLSKSFSLNDNKFCENVETINKTTVRKVLNLFQYLY